MVQSQLWGRRVGGKPYRDGMVHVLSAQCRTCIFRAGNPMHLDSGRLREMVRDTLVTDTAIICHETTYGQTHDEALCRGFYDSYAGEITALRLAHLMDVIEEVPPPGPDAPMPYDLEDRVRQAIDDEVRLTTARFQSEGDSDVVR